MGAGFMPWGSDPLQYLQMQQQMQQLMQQQGMGTSPPPPPAPLHSQAPNHSVNGGFGGGMGGQWGDESGGSSGLTDSPTFANQLAGSKENGMGMGGPTGWGANGPLQMSPSTFLAAIETQFWEQNQFQMDGLGQGQVYPGMGMASIDTQQYARALDMMMGVAPGMVMVRPAQPPPPLHLSASLWVPGGRGFPAVTAWGSLRDCRPAAAGAEFRARI